MKKNKIAIIGSGKHADAQTINYFEGYEFVGFFDENRKK